MLHEHSGLDSRRPTQKWNRVKTSKIVIMKLNTAVIDGQNHTIRRFVALMQEFPSSKVLHDPCKHRNFETFSLSFLSLRVSIHGAAALCDG